MSLLHISDIPVGGDSPLLPFFCRNVGVDHWQLNVLLGREMAQQVELLKNKAQAAVAQDRQGVITEAIHLLALQQVAAAAGAIEAAQDVHRRAFA